MSFLQLIWRMLRRVFASLRLGPRTAELEDRTLPPPKDEPAGSAAVTLLLLAAIAAAAGFIVAYVLEASTQWLGTGFGLMLAFLAAAAIIAGKQVVPQEEREEEIPTDPADPDEVSAVTQVVREGGRGISRRGLLVTAAGGGFAAATTALVVPTASLGPVTDTSSLKRTPWRSGRQLVDGAGEPIVADDIALGSFVTAFPEGADPSPIDAPLIVVRIRPVDVNLPEDREGWAPEGFLAYSKICTHAGCAVAMFDYPSYEETSPPARLVCPCHYSAFDPASGGNVMFGPAGRSLPQVPLRIDEERRLIADGEMSEPPGPSWREVPKS